MGMPPPGQQVTSSQNGSGIGSYPSFGLAMRFQVAVSDLRASPGSPSNGTSLGLWQSCKGLQFEMKYKYVEQGGQYTSRVPLPETIAWSQITLERAVEQKASLVVWTWLQKCINGWGTAPTAPGAFPDATNMTITLLDYQLNGVLQWQLEGVRPVKWVGPSLGATDNKVAIEQLVLEHQGFTCSVPPSGGSVPPSGGH